MEFKHLKEKEEFQFKKPDPSVLDTFAAPHSINEVHLVCKEFTSLCPVTGQPDYAAIIISYGPRYFCLESKSVKLYLGMYRNEGSFAEHICGRISMHIMEVIKPKWVSVQGNFASRGGVAIEVKSERGEI